MFAIKAIYDGTSFTPIQPIPIEGAYEVVITFVEPVKKVSKDSLERKTPTKLPRSTIRGLYKGRVLMAADFNNPIDDMKEYVETLHFCILKTNT